ncbi:MAG: hypothetical protein WC812_03035 [Candidatus Pacearchaeota archaeon]|jgi:hypothetical protein
MVKEKKIINKKKKAWIKIFEAFISLVFIVSIMFTVSYTEKVNKYDLPNRVQEKQIEILHLIQVNDSLRKEILNVTQIPIESNETGFPEDLINLANDSIPESLECILKICHPESNCELNYYPEEREIYTQNVIISSSINQFNPRKLSIFCWEK